MATDRWTEIEERLARFRDERDWAQFHTLKDLAAAISVEAGELQEIFLWESTATERELLAQSRLSIEDELADVLIQAMNFALAAEIDLLAAVSRKIDKNAERYPPDRFRGSSRKAGPA
jgi:NTP pyrophosphatase (non-canonical NTP hydrolase)